MAAELASRAGGRVIATYSHGVRGFGIHATEKQVLALARDPRVEMIEEAGVVHLSGTQTFPVGDYWHLDRLDGLPLSGSYSWISDGYGVDVYVVDTGIWWLHSEFSEGQVTPGVNYAGNDVENPPIQWDPTYPCGGFVNHFNGGHGTAVASLIGGQYTGGAKGVRLIPVKVFSCDPSRMGLGGDDTLGVVWALDWILEQARTSGRRSIVNMSFFYTPGEMCTDVSDTFDPHLRYECVPMLEENVRHLLNTDIISWQPVNEGVVVVTSANNQNRNLCTTQSPARMGYGGMFDTGSPSQPLVITVGGTTQGDQRYELGVNDGSNFGECVSIYAPAHVIHAAHIAAPNAYRDDNSYVVYPWDVFTMEFYASGNIVRGASRVECGRATPAEVPLLHRAANLGRDLQQGLCRDCASEFRR